MGRIRLGIQVDGRKCWTLFDSGARNTYVVGDAAAGLPRFPLRTARPSALGGKVHEIREGCVLIATVEDKPVEVDAYVIDEIGADEKGERIEVLFGALAMQKWGIQLDLEHERLDLSRYPKEFIEF